MIAYRDALDILREQATATASELLATHCALHRVLAEDFCAPFAVPRFDNSAMDGFALRVADTQSASPSQPLTLPVGRSLAAGDRAGQQLSGCAIEIMTGAAIPTGTDTVVPVENVVATTDNQGCVTHITLNQPCHLHDNIRFSGEDFSAGQCLIPCGTPLTPAHMAILYTTGITQVRVYTRPKVRIFTTGKEVSADYTAALAPSQIYDSNTPYLMASLQSMAIPAQIAGHIGDDEQKFRDLLTTQTDATILISSGAVSKGRWDFIPTVLKELGADILFHRVAIKPGKPVLFARLPDGRFFFGLPGNPVSTAIGFRFFVMPLLRRLLGLPDETPAYAKLDAVYDKKGALRLFLKAHLSPTPQGDLSLRILPGQESFKIAPLLDTNAWVVFDESPGSYAAGQPVMFYPAQPA